MSNKIYIPVESITQIENKGDRSFFVAVAKVEGFPNNIPLSPNVREPNKQVATYKKIVQTLVTSPEKFLSRNNGIKIACKSVTIDKDKSGVKGIWIECDPPNENFKGDGIYDGGHSYWAFHSAKVAGASLNLARVKLEIVCGLSDSEVVLSSLAANTFTAVDNRSKINANGGYDFIRTHMEELGESQGISYKVAYYQNQSGVPKDKRCSVLHICKLLVCLDRIRYNPLKPGVCQHPIGLSIPNLDKPHSVERMQGLLPLLTNAIWIEKQVYKLIFEYLKSPQAKGNSNLASISINGNSVLVDGSIYGFRAPEILAMPIVSAFRVFLDDDLEWMLPFEDFAEIVVDKLWAFLRSELKKQKSKGDDGLLSLYRQIGLWRDLCMIALTERDQLQKSLKQQTEAFRHLNVSKSA